MTQQTFLNILRKTSWKKRAKELGLDIDPKTNPRMIGIEGDPYANFLKIQLSFEDVSFKVKIHVLQGSCGVLEFNRPSVTFGWGMKSVPDIFNFCMDLVWAALMERRNPDYHSVIWGNQYIATVSRESSTFYRKWLEENKWTECNSAVNPRTQNEVTVWVKSLPL